MKTAYGLTLLPMVIDPLHPNASIKLAVGSGY